MRTMPALQKVLGPSNAVVYAEEPGGLAASISDSRNAL